MHCHTTLPQGKWSQWFSGHLRACGIVPITRCQPCSQYRGGIYNQAIEDLEEAKTLMDDASNFSNYKLTSAAASALLARVYLYMKIGQQRLLLE
jgi:hypothetical protein